MQIRREPIVVVQGLLVPLLIALSLLFNFSVDTQGYVDAVLLAAGGIVAAWGISAEAALPLLAGFAKALFALLLAFSVDVPTNWQAAILTAISVVTAFFTRTQVEAKVTKRDVALAG